MKWNNKLEQMFRLKNNKTDTSETNSPQHKEHLPITFNLNAMIIADTHGCLREEDFPKEIDIDVCFLLGDVFDNDLRLVLSRIINIPIYGILGNHDGFELLNRFGIRNIHNDIIEINGVKVAGLQGSIKYKYSDMPLYTDEESITVANQLAVADILISHDSPKYVFTATDFAHSGLSGITEYLNRHNISLHLHGHHHENRKTVLENGTTSICTYGVSIISINDGQLQINNYTNF